MGNFGQSCPKATIKDDSEILWSWDLCCWSLKRIWQAWSYSKSWRIPNYQKSNPTKFIFLLPDFRRIWERVSESRILWPIAWAGVTKRFIWFFKNCVLRGTKVSYSNGFKTKWSVYRDGFITNSNYQFFQDPKSNIWKTFSFLLFVIFFCANFMIVKFILF